MIEVDPIREAKTLLREARIGALATLDASGAPLTTLVSTASDCDGAPLLLLSSLSQHSRNLDGDARASLLLTSPAMRGDPLNQPRLSVNGRVRVLDSERSRARYIAAKPKAKLYAGFADFALRRLEVETVHFNGGFGRAGAMSAADLMSRIDDAGSLFENEAELLAEVDALPVAARAALAGVESGIWHAVAIDPEGLDLASGAKSARAWLPQRAANLKSWRTELRVLLQNA